MSFMDLLKRDNSMDVALEELNAGMAQALDESIAAEAPPEPETEAVVAEPIAPPAQEPAAASPTEEPAIAVEKPETARRLTAHTQSRLAALESFDKLHRDAQAHLQEMDTKLSELTTSQQLMRRFFNVLQADVHRANELELSNIGLGAEQRKLTEQLGDAARKHQERESLMEGLRQREAHLVHDNDALRATLAAAKLELVEAASFSAQTEAKFGEAIKALSARTMEVERGARESEVLREKQVSLSIDIDKALKREAEAQRKLDEMSTIHAKETAQHSELLVALSKSEKEASRLQMALESAQMKQAEMAEAAVITETDREAEAERNLAEMRGLRAEIQAMQSRLEVATNERSEAANEMARFKALLNDAMAEKQVADEKLAALIRENESAQQNLSAASANISQLALQQETEQIQLDINRQECEDLRAEIATLNARIKDLLPFERLYKVTKARQHQGTTGVAELVSVTAVKARGSSRRPTPPSRNRAV